MNPWTSLSWTEMRMLTDMRQISDGVLVARLPRLTVVLGETSLRRARQFIVREWAWCELLESDLSVLEPQTGRNKLVTCYRGDLQQATTASRAIVNDDESAFAQAFAGLRNTIFEIHGAALLARAGRVLDLHVPRGGESRTNSDAQVKIHGYTVNAESKTRTDEFPFKLPPQGDNESEPLFYRGERRALDRYEAEDLEISISPLNTPTPGYKPLRDKLRCARSQPPSEGYNLHAIGADRWLAGQSGGRALGIGVLRRE
jgi:hypothetical protein